MKIGSKRFTKVSIGIFTVMTGLVSLSGCGSSNSTNSSVSAVTQTQKSSSTIKGAPIKLALSPWTSWFLWYVAEDKGFFKQHNVNVQLVWFPVYSDSLQALATGQVDANSETLSDMLAPASKGIPLKAVLVNDNSAGGDAIVAKPGINSVEQLKGKTVATELGTVDNMLLLTALQKNNMSDSDINFTNMTVNDAGPAFIAGKLDAAVLWEPFLDKAVAEGKGHVIFSSKDTPGLIPDLLVFNQKVVETRKQDVQHIVAAWFDALNYWKQHPKEAETIMAKYADMSTNEFHKSTNTLKLFSVSDNLKAFQPGNNFESLSYTGNQTAEFLKKLGMITSIPKIDELFDDEFVKNLSK